MKAKTITRAVNAATYGGAGAFVVLLILKLAHVIDWSWWFVVAPVLIPLAIVINAVVWVTRTINKRIADED